MIATLRSIIVLKLLDWALALAPDDDIIPLAAAMDPYLKDYQNRYRQKLAEI